MRQSKTRSHLCNLNRDAITIFIRFAMADSVVDIDGKGSFQNQTEDVAISSRSAARKAAGATDKEAQRTVFCKYETREWTHLPSLKGIVGEAHLILPQMLLKS